MTTKIEKILDLLINKSKPLTINDIALALNIDRNNLRVYLNTLTNDGRVKRVNEKRPFEYRANTAKALLKGLHLIMNDKMDFTKQPDNIEIELIKEVERILNNESIR